MNSVKINDNHRRTLSSALQSVEDTLNGFIQIVVSASPPAHQRFSAEQAQALLKKMAMAQQQISDFRLRFNISARRESDPAWAIQVGVARMWEILEDCKSKALRGYGKVPEPTQPILDDEVQKLIDALQGIADTATRSDRG